MSKILKFLNQKWVKRAGWTILNTFSALIIAFVVYMFYPDVFVSVIIIPIAAAASQLLTKTLNSTPAPIL